MNNTTEVINNASEMRKMFWAPLNTTSDVSRSVSNRSGKPQSLTRTLASGPTLSLNSSTGELNGTPENPDVGSYWIMVEVTDFALVSDGLEIMITVKNTNDTMDVPTEKARKDDDNTL